MKKILALLILPLSWNVYAGTSTIINFMNMTPYTVTVSFPAGSEDCWHDTTDTSSINSYLNYYINNSVSDSGYSDYLTNFKTGFGINDLGQISTSDMIGSMTLNPSLNGQPIQMASFRGEPSAALFEGCKDATSTRGFTITIQQPNGNSLTKYYYLQDPPGSQWTLTQQDGAGNILQTITLGAGGKTNALEVGLTAGTAIVTIVSLGSAGAEAFAARSIIYAGAEDVLRSNAAYFGDFLLSGAFNAGRLEVVSFAKGYLFRTALKLAISGGLIYYTSADSQPGSGPDYSQYIDYSSQQIQGSGLVIPSGMPDDRSICVYQGSTFGITECHTVGINLSILPDGSVAFIPLPSVGSGG